MRTEKKTEPMSVESSRCSLI